MSESALEQARRWTETVWGERNGYFSFAFGVGGHYNGPDRYQFEKWIERDGGRWPDDRERFLIEAIDKSAECDVYVAPYLRSSASRKKGSALPSNIIFADVDEHRDENRGFERILIGPGGLLVDSGHGQHPYLRLPGELEPAELEQWNRRLARLLHADAGWAENKVLRLPGTWNHKDRARGGRSTPVRLVEFKPALKDWSPAELAELLPELDVLADASGNGALVPRMPEKVPAHLRARLNETPTDRSKQSYAFVAACLDAGLSGEETLALALEHGPTKAKFGERAATEIERSINKQASEADDDPHLSEGSQQPSQSSRPGRDAVGTRSASPSTRASRDSISDTPQVRPAGSSRVRPDRSSSVRPLPSGEDEPERFVPRFVPASSQSSHSWIPIDLVAANAHRPAPPEIIGLFYPDYNHLLSGESEALKTWLALAASATELQAGRGVIWVDGDDVGKGALLERLRLLGADDDSIARLFAYMLPDEPFTDESRADVLEVVRRLACRLAVFDGFNPLLHLHGLDPNSGGDVETFYGLIDPIRKAGAANVLTDNVVKASEARGAWAIGSERKKSKAEVHLGMKTLEPFVRGGIGRAKIAVHKDRPGHLTRPSPGVLVLESRDDGCSWRVQPDDSRGAEGAFRPTKLMEKVSRYLERSGDEPQSHNQIASAKLGKGEYVRDAIACLIEEGHALEFSGSNRARLVRLERPFREGEESDS